MNARNPLRIYVFAGLILLSVQPPLAPGPPSSGHFEVYCDGVGIFLNQIDSAPAPEKLVLFSQVAFPPGTDGGLLLGQGNWSETYVFPDGCVPDGKCKSIGKGKIWINTWDPDDAPPKHLSGKYELKLNGKHLEGSFLVERHDRKHPVRLCM